MKLNIPKIMRPLDLSTYAEELAGVELNVWVNPHRKMQNESLEIQIELARFIKRVEGITEDNDLKSDEKDKLLDGEQGKVDAAMERQFVWWSTILSQHSDASTHLSPDELRELDEQDPAIWFYIKQIAGEMIRAHREGIRKN